jgi:hypothetical protein
MTGPSPVMAGWTFDEGRRSPLGSKSTGRYATRMARAARDFGEKPQNYFNS